MERHAEIELFFGTCSLLGLYAALSGNSIPMCWDNQLVPS